MQKERALYWLCWPRVHRRRQPRRVAAHGYRIAHSPAPEAQYHDVVRGDTLSAIAKKYYGDASKYPKIFEANKPMLSDPDKIYPGQKLRIPPL